jgi:predicted RecB family nuclease
MVKLNFNLSASTINHFCSCPWSFKQDKLLKRQAIELPSVALVTGQAFHKLMEYFYKQKTWKTYDLFQNWEKFFNIETKVQKAEHDPFLKYAKGSGFTMIKNWVEMAKENKWLREAYTFENGQTGIETEFLLPYVNNRFEINVHGFMDLVIEVGNKLYILDWKTGKHSKEKYYLQALIYSWAMYKKFGLTEDCVRFVHPGKKQNEIVDVLIEDSDYKIVVDKVNKMFDAIETDKFDMNVNENCKWCKWIDCPANTNQNLKQLAKKVNNASNE